MMKNLFFFTFLLFTTLYVRAQSPVFEWENQKTLSSGKLIAHISESNIVVCGTYGNDYPDDWIVNANYQW